MVNVLVIGSGGREHALGWKLSQSKKVEKVFTAPGNGGTENNIDLQVTDIEGLASFAKENDCFTIVGPELPLSKGIVDYFKKNYLLIFGPTKDAARLESSKIWAKNFMKRNNIPTARFEIFSDSEAAKKYVTSVDYNVVIKADGLAAGKGVIVCNSKDEAFSAIDSILVKKAFGDAGKSIVIEERIDGIEASFIALCDGDFAIPMASSQDHKRIYDDDKGPNTGGMGAYSPTPVITESLQNEIQKNIIEKTIQSMKKEGYKFTGFLYAGIMIKDNKPYVLEYNVRMGDPECQPITSRMDFDLYEYLFAATQNRLSEMPLPSWNKKSAVCVVLASQGYPENYPKGERIMGLEKNYDDCMVFHAGTTKTGENIVTSGGRVLGVTALGNTLSSAIDNAYSVCKKIDWPHKYHRNDIGKKALLMKT